MPSTNATPTPITPPRVPLIDPRTGLIDRAWYMFFLSLFTIATDYINNPGDLGLQSLLASYNAALESLAQEVGTLPSNSALVSQLAEVDKEIQSLKLIDQSSALLSLIAELQKQLDALNSAATPQLGTLSQVNQDYVNYLGFNAAPPWMGTKTGQFWFDTTTNQLNIQQGTSVTQQIGEELYFYVQASSTITGGQIVARTGTNASTGYITAAPAPTNLTNANTILGIAAESIASGAYGRITNLGVVRNISTSPGYADGDVIYYNPAVAGGYTKVLPSAPKLKLQVGVIIKAATGVNGSIQVQLGPSSVLGETDSNVLINVLANNDLLQYDSALLYWKNIPAADVIANAMGVPVTYTTSFILLPGQTWVINNKSGSTCTVTLPSAINWPGRMVTFKNMQPQTLVSSLSNVVPIDGTSPGTAILLAVVGNWATMVSDGTNWIIMQQASYNNLLLE